MQVMKPVMRSNWPEGPDWIYEVKYDGFRCVVNWNGHVVYLTSQNGTNLTAQFPEIERGLTFLFQQKPPMIFDGELVILNNPLQGNFSRLQQRGRMKRSDIIAKAADERPATLMVFDLLEWAGKSMVGRPLMQRSDNLKECLKQLPKTDDFPVLRPVPQSSEAESIWKQIFEHKAEGLIAKRTSSLYQPSKQHHDWYKVKNWRTVTGALTAYNPENDYFSIAVFDNENWIDIGTCKHGLTDDTRQVLQRLFRDQGIQQNGSFKLPPAIAGKIHTLDLIGGVLREPQFVDIFQLDQHTPCSKKDMQLALALLPETVEISNMDKVFWPKKELTKGDLLVYMREAAPYLLPFLKQKALTVIRFPDGEAGKHFFQKHLPDYAPNFFPGKKEPNDVPIQCESLEALIWLANQGAIEYHVPFQQKDRTSPTEIVFDLDPPDKSRFDLAVMAAKLIKQILDELALTAFVKTSGNKGLQIHIPLPAAGELSYAETALFTEAVADTAVRIEPDSFTTERLKKHRHGRLYIDYVQHGRDKTIIAPYSPRGTKEATVATPLFWHELNEALHPDMFTIETVIDRIHKWGNPLQYYHQAGEEQSLQGLLQLIGR